MIAATCMANGLPVYTCNSSDFARRWPVGRPAVSMHLRVLQDAGLVRHERAGNRRLYHLDPHGLVLLRDHLDAYWSLALGAFESAASWRQKGHAMALDSEISV